MEIRKGLEEIFKRLYFRQNEEQSCNLKFGTFCTVFSADTFDECLPAILTLIQHSLMEICWEYEALTFSSSLANKTPFKQWATKETLTATATRTEIKTHFKTKITNRRWKKEGSWQAAERWNPWPAVVLSAGRPVLHHQPPPLIQLWAKNKREQKRWPRELQPAGTDAWRWTRTFNLSAQRTHPCARDQPRRLPQLVWDPTSCAFTWHVMVARKKTTTDRNKCAKPEGLWKIRKHINDACCSGLPHAS